MDKFIKMHGQKGLSLVELMVAMVISLFLSAGVFAMFSMSATNVTTTSHFNQLQENGRIALALMERDVSQLGFMADMTGEPLSLGVNTRITAAAIPAGNDCVGAGANNASLPNNTAANFRRIWGYEQGGTESLACLSNVITGTDVLQIKRLSGPSVVNPNEQTSYYLGANQNEAVIFSGNQVTPVIANGRYWKYLHHVYYIQEDNGVPQLRRRVLKTGGMNTTASVEQLVDGVENMRILYGFDTNSDRSADSFMPAENVSSLMWDGAPLQRLVAVRIFLLLRTIEQDPSYTNKANYRLGDKIIEVDDHFRRKVVSTTVVLENPIIIGGRTRQ
ncbi:PilW family protein [Shewanella benthica]|uniref:Type IV pilus assembly protein PilW n=1 Tax=Shewanella benthica KT99 TaxID=314608 RepID=A9DAW2_9GAMM|nr:PilW family protein [Shewanella benthica]EDQ00652.1 hypothetical protein KT99_03864 [Shewanella benthica KT99]